MKNINLMRLCVMTAIGFGVVSIAGFVYSFAMPHGDDGVWAVFFLSITAGCVALVSGLIGLGLMLWKKYK